MPKKKSDIEKSFYRWQSKIKSFVIPDTTDRALDMLVKIVKSAQSYKFGVHSRLHEIETIAKAVKKGLEFPDRPLSAEAKRQISDRIREMANAKYFPDSDEWVADQVDYMIDYVFR